MAFSCDIKRLSMGDMEIECEHVIRVESADYDYNSEIGYPYQNVFDTLIEGYWCAIFGS